MLHRSIKRPRLTHIDRSLLLLLTCRVRTWKAALVIIEPETILGQAPQYLIRDSDAKYDLHFIAVVAGTGIEALQSRAKHHANAICE